MNLLRTAPWNLRPLIARTLSDGSRKGAGVFKTGHYVDCFSENPIMCGHAPFLKYDRVSPTITKVYKYWIVEPLELYYLGPSIPMAAASVVKVVRSINFHELEKLGTGRFLLPCGGYHYYKKLKLHREDGPAIMLDNQYAWWIDGKFIKSDQRL
jgi:hypothetical protein